MLRGRHDTIGPNLGTAFLEEGGAPGRTTLDFDRECLRHMENLKKQVINYSRSTLSEKNETW